MKRLFEIVDYQFRNGGRISHYNGFIRKYVEFVQKNFGKFRGMCGYTLSVHESDIIMFTRIILKENCGRIGLTKLFEEFEKRGLLFDRESKKRIIELFERMNLLEKRSDSGDAQYVKYVL
jgi:DNA phosphorothioation-dependent restriction protein DptG